MGAGISDKAKMMVAVIGVRRLALVTVAILLPVILGIIVVMAVMEDRRHAATREAQHILMHATTDRVEGDFDRNLSAWLFSIQQSGAVGSRLISSGAALDQMADSFQKIADSYLPGRAVWTTLSLHDLTGVELALAGAEQSISALLQQEVSVWRPHLEAGSPRLISLDRPDGAGAVAAYLIPLLHNDQSAGLIALQYDSRQLETILARTNPASVGQRMLLNRNGKVMASTWVPSQDEPEPPHDLKVGQLAPQILRDTISWGEFGSSEGRYEGGRRFLAEYSQLRNSDWMVVVSVPCCGLFGQFLREAGSLYLIMALSLLAAGLIGGILAFAVVGRNTAEQRLRVLEAEKTADRRLTELAANFPGVVFRRVLLPDGQLTYPLLAGQDRLLLSVVGEFFKDGKQSLADLGELIRSQDGPDNGLVAWQKQLCETSKTLEPVKSDFSLLDDVGRRRHYRTQSNAWRDADGSVIWDGVVLDTTDVQEAEQARTAGEQRLAVALKAARAGLWDWDLTSGTCVWTENMWPLFGRPQLDIDPDLSVISDLVHADDRERVRAEMLAAISGCSSFDTEFRISLPQGEIRWLHASAQCFGNRPHSTGTGTSSAGAPIRTERMTGILLDVTERVCTARLLQEAKEAADRANLAKSKFLAAASHDLRQPVQSLLFFVHVLGERLTADPSFSLILSIQSALDTLKSLLDGVLDLSKLDAGVIKPEREIFPVHTLLDRIGSGYAPRYAAKGLVLRMLPSDGLVDSDPVLLGRILSNLLENALTYTSAGGVVVGCRRRGGQLRIEVWDTGIGIPLEQQSEIFEEFVQIRAGRSDDQQGLGLGLAIVSRLANLLDHDIALRSVPGRGSCFAVTVPLVPPDLQAAPDDASAVVPTEDCDGLVLVIKDEARAVDALEILLTGWGYEVIGATSATEAMARLASSQRRPDMVVSDPRLIESDGGLIVLEQLRGEFGETLPGIILTGDTDPSLRSRAEAQGLTVVHKPVSPENLRNLLQAGQRVARAEA